MGNFDWKGSKMMRKMSMFLAVMMLCLPIGGIARPAMGNSAPSIHMPTISAHWWVGPYELAIACACLFVLALATCLRQDKTDPADARL